MSLPFGYDDAAAKAAGLPPESAAATPEPGDAKQDAEFQFLRILKRAVDKSEDVFLITEAERVDEPGPRVIYVNSAFERMTGYQSADLLGKTPRILQGPKSNRAALDRIRESLKAWRPIREEIINYRKDGSEFSVDMSIMPVADERGWFRHWVAIQRDTAEQYIERERLILAQEVAAMGTYDIQLEPGTRTWSARMFKIFGLDAGGSAPSVEEVLSMCHREDRARVAEHFQLLPSGKPLQLTYRILRPDGVLRWISSSAKAVLDARGMPVRFVGVAFDVTEAKQNEARLRESQEELRSFAARLQTVIERERLLIARELHDQLGQALTGIRMELDWILRKHAGKGKKPWVALLKECMNAADAAIAQVRKLCTELRPELLDSLGLRAAIEWETQQFERRAGFKCEVQIDDDGTQLSSHGRIAVFRIFQEALTNVARHARASRVSVSFLRKEQELVLTVRDDGAGFSTENLGAESLGILGMRERALFIGAAFHLESAPGSGTSMVLRVPLGESGHAAMGDA
jgi:PAS domain S-box-containing protein